MVELWLGTGLVGAGVGFLAYSGQDYYARALDYLEQDLGDKLRRMHTPTHRLRQYLVAWSAAIVLVFVVFLFALNSALLGGLMAVFVACAPWYLVRRMAELRRRKLEDQLADAFVTFSSAIRAGLSLLQALDILAQQCPRPVSEEFQQIVGEYKLGKPLDRVLTEANQRLRSENLALFTASLLASRESGGKLNETVERIAQSVLEIQRLERKIQSETAQARKSAIYMALAPAFILGVYYFMDPENTLRLFTTFAGNLVLCAAVLLNLLAYFWARVILTPDI
jgi:tight adherence protein B